MTELHLYQILLNRAHQEAGLKGLKARTDFYFHNLLQALAMLDDVEMVAGPFGFTQNLMSWKSPCPESLCGSAYCFGGWVAIHPHFQSLGIGVRDAFWHSPAYLHLHGSADRAAFPVYCNPCWVSEFLFGDPDMFAEASSGERGVSPVEIIRRRIQHRMDAIVQWGP